MTTQYSDDEIIDIFANWKKYRKPEMKQITKTEMKRITRDRRPSQKQQQWGRRKNWGHGRRG